MWFYMYPHFCYILVRYFPFHNRRTLRFLLIGATFIMLLPQIILLQDQRNWRDCDRNLLQLLITSVIFSVSTVCFTVIFSIMEPIPWVIKLAFHIFGGIVFIFQLVLDAKSLSEDHYCSVTVPQLYTYMYILAVVGTLCMIFYILLVPFWLLNFFRRDSLLNTTTREGVCWPLVQCCGCIWHV
ncbi:hypothetical protein ACHWQZ_G016545 [Mnemiopsis leidyi]